MSSCEVSDVVKMSDLFFGIPLHIIAHFKDVIDNVANEAGESCSVAKLRNCSKLDHKWQNSDLVWCMDWLCYLRKYDRPVRC